jgi:hypothetical protein
MLGQAGCPVRLGPAETREEGSLRGGEVMSLSLFTEDQMVGILGEVGAGGYRRPPGAAAIPGRAAFISCIATRDSRADFSRHTQAGRPALDESPLRYRPLAIETDRGSPLGCT